MSVVTLLSEISTELTDGGAATVIRPEPPPTKVGNSSTHSLVLISESVTGSISNDDGALLPSCTST